MAIIGVIFTVTAVSAMALNQETKVKFWGI